jgi:hypothetical protein
MRKLLSTQSRWFRRLGVTAVLAVTLLGAACEETPNEPTETPTPLTENFAGNLARGGAAVHSFSVPKQGQVTLTLTGFTPVDDTVTLSLAIGTWDGTACTVLAQNNAAKIGTILFGTALPGNFCVRLADLAEPTIPETIEYTVSVVRPS